MMFPPRAGTAGNELPVVQKVAPGLFRLGAIEISKRDRSVSFPVLVNQHRGLLEYLLVRIGGKTHESLFRTEVDPTQIQMALLLIGLEGTDHPLSRQGDPDAPKGNPVEITVSQFKDGRMATFKPEIWVTKRSADKVAESEPLQWVFTGSLVRGGRFLAQAEGSIVAIYHDPVALIDNASRGGESDRIWLVNEATVPPVGTPLTMTIHATN
jgi:hypothetical protein